MSLAVTTVLLCVVLILIILVLVGLGWRNRRRRQADIAPLPQVPARLPEPVHDIEGQYVATTTAADWLDRIAVRTLGIRSNARFIVLPDAVLITRPGNPEIYIGRPALRGVSLASGMAGKFVEKDGLLVLTWMLGDTAVDTGFRTRRAADKNALVAAVKQLLITQDTPGKENK